MLHIFHVPHFENMTQNCLDLKCMFNFKTGGMAYKALCKRKCFRMLLFLNFMALQSSVNQVLILLFYLEIGKSVLKCQITLKFRRLN